MTTAPALVLNLIRAKNCDDWTDEDHDAYNAWEEISLAEYAASRAEIDTVLEEADLMDDPHAAAEYAIWNLECAQRAAVVACAKIGKRAPVLVSHVDDLREQWHTAIDRLQTADFAGHDAAMRRCDETRAAYMGARDR